MLGGEREIPARVPRETGMSEYLGDPDLTSTTATAVTTPDTKRVANSTVTATVHEAYAFACLNCGFGWEQAYEIEHRTDHQGQPLVTYRANGVPVPSPLSRPSCPGCGGAHVRILRAGRVSEAAAYWHAPHPARPTKAAETARPAETAASAPAASAATAAAVTAADGGTGTETVAVQAAADQAAAAQAHPRARGRRHIHLPFHFRLRRRHTTPEP